MNWVRVGAILAALAVAFGAFGAHAMASRLTPERMETWRTAAQYHLVHAVAIVVIGALAPRLGGLGNAAGWSLTAGVLVFSGTLYALCLTGRGWLGAITPIGGVSMIVGWVLLALAASRLAD